MKRFFKKLLLLLVMTTLTLAGCDLKSNPPVGSSATKDDTGIGLRENRTLATNESQKSLAKRSSELEDAGDVIASDEQRKAFKAGIDLLRKTNIEQTAKQVGDAAVDGELIGWDGKTVRLSQLWQQGPVVLMWYRGGWCPSCNRHLRAMQSRLKEIEKAGAKLIVLTPELPEKAKETAETNDVNMVALHDRENRLADAYGIMFDLPAPIVPIYRDKLKICSYNGCNRMQLPLAATYVIDQSGTITYAFLDADYKNRAKPDEVIAATIAAKSGHQKSRN